MLLVKISISVCVCVIIPYMCLCVDPNTIPSLIVTFLVLLCYVGNRSSQLRRLQISYGSLYNSWSDLLKKAPLLEEVALTFTIIWKETVADFSSYCPMLKSFIYNNYCLKYSTGVSSADDFVIAIAKGMPQLLHLQLTGSKMTNEGLQTILDGCPNLQSLDLRGCFNINLNESCGKLCKERIKNLRLPGDSTEGHKVAPYDSEDDFDYNDLWYGCLTESSDDEDYSGIMMILMLELCYFQLCGGSSFFTLYLLLRLLFKLSL